MKILIWNIKFFAKNRITGQTATGGTSGERAIRTKNDASRALQTLTYILSTVRRTDPDVFVVVEPRSSAGFPGTLADPDSAGPAGLITLLATLRSTLSDQWWLVPPQRINSTRTDPIDPGSQYTECIGVYWRADRMTFTGPWANTADGIRPATVATPTDYTGAWAGVVPAGTRQAGRTIYVRGDSLAGFPELTSRIPFCTTFTELGGNQRLLELYSVHMDTYERGRAIDSLTRLPFADADKKVTLVAGDMNVNVSKMSGYDATGIGHVEAEGFGTLYPGPETPLLGKPSIWPPTTVQPGQSGTPGAYLGATTYDWGFVHYGKNAVPAVQPTCAVLDRVAGVGIARAMSSPLGDFTRALKPLDLDTFHSRLNFGKIGTPEHSTSSPTVLADGTSDHLPILLTV